MTTTARPWLTQRRTVAAAAAIVGFALVGAWVLRSFDPNAAGSLFPPCLFLAVTGLYCPGCGITRALHALAHFDVPRAMAMNPFVVLSLPLLAAMGLHAFDRRMVPAAVTKALFNGRAWIAAIVLFGVLRNLPWWPFASLAPG